MHHNKIGTNSVSWRCSQNARSLSTMHINVPDHILSGVRQGCVLSPRLSCAAIELAMSEWRLANPHGGVDFGDAMPRVLDLRFADDILIFANTKEEVQNLLDSSVRHLATAGLVLNTSKDCGINSGKHNHLLSFRLRIAT